MVELAPPPSAPKRKFAFTWRRKQKARRLGPVTALDLEGQMLRVVQSAPRGSGTTVTRVEITSLEVEAGGERPQAEVLGKAVAAVLQDLRLRPAQVVMGVPRHLVILRTVVAPLIEDERELASMVHMQVARDLPFRAEEAVIDFLVHPDVLPARNGGDDATRADSSTGHGEAASRKVEIMVAVVRRETVEFYEQVAAAAKVKLVALGWLSQANARWLEACQSSVPNEAVALISLRPEEVGIDVVNGNGLRFSRGAALATASPENGASADSHSENVPGTEDASGRPVDFVEAAVIEVVRSLHSYGGAEQSLPVSKLLVAGATGQEKLVVAALANRLKLPCTLLEAPVNLELPQTARQHISGAIGAAGLALGVNDPEGLPIDFLSPKRPAVQRNLQRIKTLAFTALGAALLIGFLGVRSHLVNKRMRVNRALQEEVAEAEKKLPLYRRMQQQAAGLQNWSKNARDWLEHYAYLSAVLPGCEDIYITSLSVSGQGNIHLAVQARSGEILANLDRQLRAAGYEVKPLAITPGSDRHGYNFRSTVELIVSPKLQIDLAKVPRPSRPEDDDSLQARKPGRGGRS